MKKPEGDDENELIEPGIKPGINVADLIKATNHYKQDDVLCSGIIRYNQLLNTAAAEDFKETLQDAIEDPDARYKIDVLRMKSDLAVEGKNLMLQKKYREAYECFEQLENAGHAEGKLLKGFCLIMMNAEKYFDGIYLMASACFDSMENHFITAIRHALEVGCEGGLFKNPRKIKHNVNEAEMALQLNTFISAIDQEKNPKLAAAILLQNLRKFME